MSTHHLDDDNLFLRSFNHGEIRIRKITNPSEVIATWEEYKIVNTINDGLKIYDVVIFGLKLRELEAELQKYRMYVNRQGYCYVLIDYIGGGSKLHKVNDFFNWSKYGVVPNITTIWNRCEMDTNTIVIDYEKKEKAFVDMKLLLEKDKTLHHHLNEALELKTRDLIEKDKYIAKKDEELREMAECVEKNKQELNEKERCIALKDQELKDCKLQLEKRDKELSILIGLWERRLGAFDNSNNYNKGFIDKDKELFLHMTSLEEKERELKKMSNQLSVEQKRANDLKFAINSMVSYVNHVNVNVDKEINYNFISPAISGDRECVSAWRDLEDGSTGATVDI